MNVKEVSLGMQTEFMGLTKGNIVTFIKTVIHFQALNKQVII
jgi:hypothetical protein